MSGYRHEWDCCDTVTVTQAWEPERCPFCELDELRTHVCTDNSDTLKNALTDNAKLRALLERAAGALGNSVRCAWSKHPQHGHLVPNPCEDDCLVLTAIRDALLAEIEGAL